MVKQPYIMPLTGGGGGGGGTSDLFWCTYGVTTYTEVAEALNSNKLPVVMYGDTLYVFSENDDPSSEYLFTSATNTAIYTLSLSAVSDTWSALFVVYEKQSNKASSIESTSTNVQYAGAKAVYDFAVAKNQGIANAGKFLVVGNDGNVTTATISQWSGGNY